MNLLTQDMFVNLTKYGLAIPDKAFDSFSYVWFSYVVSDRQEYQIFEAKRYWETIP